MRVTNKQRNKQTKAEASTIAFLIAVAMIGTACEKELIVKPETDVRSQETPSPASVMISYDETSITTSSPQPSSGTLGISNQSATSNAHRVLRDFERTRRTMTIHANGSVSLEVRYLEGNSDIRIPMELYNRIKHRLHPPDPRRKPITRFTIVNNTYTGFAEDGTIVHVQRFPQQPTGMVNVLAKSGVSTVGLSKSERMEEIEKSGARVQQLNEREILVERVIAEPGSQAALKKEAVNTETGQTIRSVTYDRSGRPLLAQRFAYQVVNDLPVPSLVVTYRYGEHPAGGWGVVQTRLEQRTNISVQRF